MAEELSSLLVQLPEHWKLERIWTNRDGGKYLVQCLTPAEDGGFYEAWAETAIEAVQTVLAKLGAVKHVDETK